METIMHYSNLKFHLIKLYLLTALTSFFFISCNDTNITDSKPPITSELVGTWNPLNVEGNVNYYESFSLQKDLGVHEVKDESNRTILYRYFKWKVKVPRKVIEITLLRRSENGVEHYVHGFKEVIDISIDDEQLVMYDKSWVKKEND